MQALKKEDQKKLDAKNQEYWDTLCGSHLAQVLGITDFSKESLRKFDDYYMGYYPYLLPHIRFETLRGKRILEVGLGYGTLSQQLAGIASEYTGLDIAKGPVDVVNERLRLYGLPGQAVQGSILSPSFAPESFDAIVSIGCLHHTGNFPEALRQVRNLLAPGGGLAIMVYNAYSYRRWLTFTKETMRHFIGETFGVTQVDMASQLERSAYDQGAPETAFVSAKMAKRLLAGMSDVKIIRENASPEGIFKSMPRERMLAYIAPHYGLDLYIQATK